MYIFLFKSKFCPVDLVYRSIFGLVSIYLRGVHPRDFSVWYITQGDISFQSIIGSQSQQNVLQ